MKGAFVFLHEYATIQNFILEETSFASGELCLFVRVSREYELSVKKFPSPSDTEDGIFFCLGYGMLRAVVPLVSMVRPLIEKI
ncbi:MAG: hypothetical protein WAU28_05050 [Candidatus Moraniibacteriota bacterium]